MKKIANLNQKQESIAFVHTDLWSEWTWKVLATWQETSVALCAVVSQTGTICCDLLRLRWTPSIQRLSCWQGATLLHKRNAKRQRFLPLCKDLHLFEISPSLSFDPFFSNCSTSHPCTLTSQLAIIPDAGNIS